MSKFKRLLILFIGLVLLTNNKGYATNAPVEVGNSSSSSTVSSNVSTLSAEEGKALLDEINKDMKRGAQYGNLLSIYSALKATGFSDYESTAILVNMNRESSMNPSAMQCDTWTGGVGLIQWDDRKDKLEAWSKTNCTHGLIPMQEGHQIGCLACQVAYVLYELDPSGDNQWQKVAPNPKYTKVNFSEVAQDINDANIDLTKAVDVDTWRKMTNVVAMSMYFTSSFERCGYDIDIYNLGAKQSPKMYKLLTGTDAGTLASSSNEQLNQDLAEALVNSGLWDESKLSEFCRLTETNVQADLLDKAKRNNLSNEELYNLSSWEDNVREDAENTGLIKIVRIITMFVGIMFTIWVILIYLAYWFDRINNFVDLDLVGILTLGKLRVSDTEDDCTFKVSSLNQSGKKTVNHRAILFICITGILFGVLIISGTLYKLLQVFVLKVLDILR